jgi:hypothetical protein
LTQADAASVTIGESAVIAVIEPTFSTSGNTSYCAPTSATIVSIKNESHADVEGSFSFSYATN